MNRKEAATLANEIEKMTGHNTELNHWDKGGYTVTVYSPTGQFRVNDRQDWHNRVADALPQE